MASNHCRRCDVHYPPGKNPCPACGTPTDWSQAPMPDKGWERWIANYGDHHVAEPLPVVHPDRLVEWHGELWIHDKALVLAGYEHQGVGTIVRFNRSGTGEDMWFEIMGPASQVGVVTSQRGWWLRRVVPEDEFKELAITGAEDAR